MRSFRIVCLTVFLAACTSPRAAITPTPTFTSTSTTSIPMVTATNTAWIVPTAVQTGTYTSSPLVMQTVTFAPGMVAVEHQSIPGFVFVIDPLQWEVVPIQNMQSQEHLNFLRNRVMPDCELRAPHIGGFPSPQWLYRKILGNHDFSVFDYGNQGLYSTISLITDNVSYFDLRGLEDANCRAALEIVLANMQEAAVFYAQSDPVALMTATPNPTPEGYQCNSLPPRLKVGDNAFVIADAVWFRTEPRRSEDTQSRLLSKHAPYIIEIIFGPVCADDYSFWAVTVYTLGEGDAEQWSGWIAEVNATDYFLEALP